MALAYDALIPALKQLLPAQSLGVLARAVLFIRRMRALRAGQFLWAVVLSRFAAGWPAFEEARRWYERLTGTLLAPRPFHLRFKSTAAVELFSRAFERVVAAWKVSPTPRVKHRLAKWFPDIVLWDSTVIQVADELKATFPGIRGVAAGIKISLAVSVYGLVPLYALLVAATRNDMMLFPPLTMFRAGTLLLFDRGFVAYERLRDIAAAGCSFVCRHRTNGNALIVRVHHAPAYVKKALRRQPNGVWLRDVLPSSQAISKPWDIDVLLRPNLRRSVMVPARMVILSGPKRTQRRYLTNLPRGAWSGSALAELYRLRWQIELVFKELKQHLALEKLATKDPNAVQVLAWASLIALVVCRAIVATVCPVRGLIGLGAQLRPELATRAVRAGIRILGRALVAPDREAAMLVQLFLSDVVENSRNLRRAREDSVMRISRLGPREADA